jgi:hypothetical protein
MQPGDDEPLNIFADGDGDDGDLGGGGNDRDQNDGGFSLELDADGNPIDPSNDGDNDDAGDGGGDSDDEIKIKKSDWQKFQTDLAEMRGFYTANKGGGQQQQRRQQTDDNDDDGNQPGPRQQQQQQRQPSQQDFDQQLDQLSDGLVDDLVSGDKNVQKGAIKKILTLGAQAGYNNAKQLFGSMAPAQAEGIIDGYVSRKAAKDPLYDKGVGDRFEEILGKYDTSVLVGQPRKVVQDTLDTMYQRAKGDWADAQYSENQNRRSQRQQRGDTEPQNLGGGRSGSTQAGRKMAIPSDWVAWARQAGIPDDEMQQTFADMVRNQRGRN